MDKTTDELKREYNAKLKEYRDFEVEAGMDGLDKSELEYLEAKVLFLTVSCNHLITKIRGREVVTSKRARVGFDLEPQQLPLAS
jgi:hypothetical protein